jgi:diaminohydroxyphosphoribosylaminopyrimidine deaminase/5-amino-6-(5-phosphoribosylamino)uracil reductase
LNVREAGQPLARQPLRVILDSRYRTPPAARVLAKPGHVLVLGAGADVKRSALESAGARVEAVALESGHVDLAAALRRLGELEINEVWVEAGPVLNGALLAAGLVDELVVYQAASVLGSTAGGMFDMPALDNLAERPVFRLHSARRVGDDLRLVYTPASPQGKSG